MTDRLRTAPLNTEHQINHTTHGRIPSHATRLVNSMYAFGIENRHLVVNDKPDADSSAYTVLEVETSSVPLEDADMAVDATRVYLCHCKGFHYNAWPEEFGIGTSPHEIGECKHTELVRRKAREVAGEGQAQLGGVPGDD